MLNRTDQLKARVEQKKHELQARLAEIKADASADAIDQKTRIKQKLDELELTLKEGWDRLSDRIADKLDSWLRN